MGDNGLISTKRAKYVYIREELRIKSRRLFKRRKILQQYCQLTNEAGDL
jgi:hypothetical protein